MKNPHKIIDIEYQNPCNVCAALSFEGFQETREPSEDTPQGFRACHSDLFGGVGLNLFSFPNAIANSNVALSPKKTPSFLWMSLYEIFFGYSAPKKKTTGPFFPMQRFNHEGHGDHFCTGFQPTEITQEMQGLILLPSQKKCTTLLAKHGKTHP